mmetsp:Transcript_60518/g.165768  ORF Transcript_60518/g.165768 Transcript_60518/m.165768 type:complete len:142 (+) Transcript_60518:138-563(+)
MYVDTAVHQSLRVDVSLLKAGSQQASVDIYLRYGSWPTTIVHDALLQPDQLNPRARFVLPPSRLFNERLHIMLVGRGDTWVEYALSANTAPNTLLALLLLLALGVVAGAVVLFVRIRQGVRFLEPDEHIHKVAGARHASMP